MSITSAIVYAAGNLSLTYIAVKLLLFAYTQLLPSFNSLGAYTRKSKTPYAFVTGSTDGIGFALATDLARRGFNLILLSRNPTKLLQTKANILKTYPKIDIKTLAIDAIKCDPETLEKSLKPFASLPITILANNVGGGPPHSNPIDSFLVLPKVDATTLDQMITLNARFMAQLTRLLLPQLSASAEPRSLIFNISSGAQMGMPNLVPYSASKGFVRSFSFALARECRSHKLPVDVLNIVVGEVQSNSNFGVSGLLKPTSKVYAKSLLDRIGRFVSLGDIEITPYPFHAVFMGLLSSLPEWAAQKACEQAMEETMVNLSKTR